MATRTIGATGRQHPTIADWESYLDGLGTLTEDEIGECYNDAEFVVAGNIVTFSGFTASAGARAILRPASGQGFADGIGSNPLRYDASYGVALRCTGGYSTGVAIAVSYVELIGLQVQMDNASGFRAIDVNSSSLTGNLIDKCIADKKQGNNSSTVRVRSGTLRSSLVINRVNGSDADGVDNEYSGTTAVTDCTVVKPSDVTASGNAFKRDSGTPAVTGCAGFGFSGFSGSTNFTGSHNASDQAISFGTNNQASKTYASQFEGTAVASMDFRAKSGGDLINNGTGSLSDIIGQAVSGGTKDIGAWELQAGGGGGGGASFPFGASRLAGGILGPPRGILVP